jgi:NAD-dependent deacetylase
MKLPAEEYPPPGIKSDTLNAKVREAAALIQSTRHIVVFTGAGSSTPSGIPDFRSPGSGLWTRFSPSEYASLSAFRYQPEKFYQWLHPLASLIVKALPNPFHTAIQRLENHGKIKAIITQNIDCLHQKAGSKAVIEVHGTLNTLSCTGCYKQFPSDQYLASYIEKGIIPSCPVCSRILKPDVILFEEQLPIKTWLQARKAAKTCDLMIVAGSSLSVTPACELPLLALSNHAKMIVINQMPTYIDEYANVLIRDDVSAIVPLIVAEALHEH